MSNEFEGYELQKEIMTSLAQKTGKNADEMIGILGGCIVGVMQYAGNDSVIIEMADCEVSIEIKKI